MASAIKSSFEMILDNLLECWDGICINERIDTGIKLHQDLRDCYVQNLEIKHIRYF